MITAEFVLGVLISAVGVLVGWWKTGIDRRISSVEDALKEGFDDAEESRRHIHRHIRDIERRIDKAGINGG